MPKFALSLVATFAALALAAPAGARAAGPNPSTMTVQAGDFAQVGLTSSNSFSSGSLTLELRDFQNSTVAGTQLPVVISLAILAPNAQTAGQVYANAGASFLVGFIKSAAKHHATVKFGAARPLTIGDQSQLLTLSASYHVKHKHRKLTIRVNFIAIVVRQDSAVGLVVALALPHESIRSATAQLAADMVAHMRAGQIPVNQTQPTVSGAYQLNAGLVAQTGSWTGNPTSYAFQWYRCDAAGNNCQPIPSATGSTYVTTQADVGSTLEVAVTATNEDGTSQAVQSAPSGAIQ